MSYQPVLEMPSGIKQGLAQAMYELHGGVVRIASGQIGAGQIVALLRDTGGLQSSIAQQLIPVMGLTTNVAVLGVAALGVVVLSDQLGQLREEIEGLRDALDSVARDADVLIVGELETANEHFREAQLSATAGRVKDLDRAIELYMKAASLFQGRFDQTPDQRRQELHHFIRAMAMVLCGDLAARFLRGDDSVVRRSEQAVEKLRPRTNRLVSLSLGCGPDFAAWRRRMSSDGQVQDADCRPALWLHPRLRGTVSFEQVEWLFRRLDTDLYGSRLVELLRPALPRMDAVGFDNELQIAELEKLRAPRGIYGTLSSYAPWKGTVTSHASFPEVAKAVLAPGVSAALLGEATASYPSQFLTLSEAGIGHDKLLSMFGSAKTEGILVRSDLLRSGAMPTA